jgi:hypothetical protein
MDIELQTPRRFRSAECALIAVTVVTVVAAAKLAYFLLATVKTAAERIVPLRAVGALISR